MQEQSAADIWSHSVKKSLKEGTHRSQPKVQQHQEDNDDSKLCARFVQCSPIHIFLKPVDNIGQLVLFIYRYPGNAVCISAV